MTNIFLILTAVAFSVAAQYFVKKGINQLTDISHVAGIHMAYYRMSQSPYVLTGMIMYVVSVLCWLYALTRVDLSYATPFLALTYVLMVLVSWLLLGESINPVRWIGLLVIVVGVMIVSFS